MFSTPQILIYRPRLGLAWEIGISEKSAMCLSFYVIFYDCDKHYFLAYFLEMNTPFFLMLYLYIFGEIYQLGLNYITVSSACIYSCMFYVNVLKSVQCVGFGL